MSPQGPNMNIQKKCFMHRIYLIENDVLIDSKAQRRSRFWMTFRFI